MHDGDLVPMYLTDDEARFYTAVTGLFQAAVTRDSMSGAHYPFISRYFSSHAG
jgi:hypothetical protein